MTNPRVDALARYFPAAGYFSLSDEPGPTQIAFYAPEDPDFKKQEREADYGAPHPCQP